MRKLVLIFTILISISNYSQIIDDKAILYNSKIVVFQNDTIRTDIFDSSKKTELNDLEMLTVDEIVLKAVDKHNKETVFEKISVNKYLRQYVIALDENGEKIVWINCFDEFYKDHIDWEHQIVSANDGGIRFFNLKVNLNRKKIYQFSTNE